MELDVLLNGEVAGTLSYTASTHRYAFRYSPAWLSRKDRYALGPTLPLELAVVAHGAEAAVQEQHSAAVRCASSSRTCCPKGRRLTMRRARTGSRRATSWGFWLRWAGRLPGRFSCASPERSWRPWPRSAGLTGNEFFCMRLAHWAKLPVAEVALVRVPEPVLVVKRFDREHRPGRVVRRHIIDGCQALGLSSALKYERPYGDARDVRDLRDGASLPMLFALLARSPRPVAERLALLRWTLFQVLIGNTDAHAKNLSFYVTREGLSLAPAYDLVCGIAFNGERLLDTYALAIGDAFQARELSPFEWAHFAHACALPFRQLSTELSRMAGRVHEALPKACDDARRAGVELAQIEQIQGLIAAECERQAEMAPAVAKVDPSLY